MEANKEQILNALIDNHPFQGMGDEEYKMALQAMEEYATAKLHLLQHEYHQVKERGAEYTHRLQDQLDTLQQEYDKLHSDHHEIEQQANHLREAYDNVGREYQQLKGEYDKLKRKNEMQEAAIELLLEKFAALKDKAEAYEKALIHIQENYVNAGKFAADILSSYNSNTNQNENT